MKIFGVDFTSAPCRRKPITVASAVLTKDLLRVEAIERHETFADFEQFLARPGPWIGGFDFPFGLPAELQAAWAALRPRYGLPAGAFGAEGWIVSAGTSS